MRFNKRCSGHLILALSTTFLFFNARERKSERSELEARRRGGGETSKVSQLPTLSSLPFCAGVQFSRVYPRVQQSFKNTRKQKVVNSLSDLQGLVLILHRNNVYQTLFSLYLPD